MVDNKKQRKSTRSFNMEKHVERHFEIEKEEVPTVAIPEARGFSWWIVAAIAGIGCVAAAGLWFFVGRKEND